MFMLAILAVDFRSPEKPRWMVIRDKFDIIYNPNWRAEQPEQRQTTRRRTKPPTTTTNAQNSGSIGSEVNLDHVADSNNGTETEMNGSVLEENNLQLSRTGPAQAQVSSQISSTIDNVSINQLAVVSMITQIV
jgi:hypothetical protein